MVENGEFLNRLRNGHLEKSAVTGICSPSCSPTTAKTPAKVHLRLRFQNLGKPRTAGLCGRAAGACDCGPLSCAKIERPSPLEKPSCKVRFYAQNRFRKYRQKVTVTTLAPTAFHPTFQLFAQMATFAFAGESGYTLGSLRKIAHRGLHAETRGCTLVQLCRAFDRPVSDRRTAGESGCTPYGVCPLFLRRRSPAGLRKSVIILPIIADLP